ncbi:MAG: DUF3857 domain-containing protein [Bacteroidales bacterium]|nr:DUF3857 domain-containing protein [Bacteroidota bacterium]MBL6949045.1 DUF3857 domain-containing protein [Bacteroidales bacterium]
MRKYLFLLVFIGFYGISVAEDPIQDLIKQAGDAKTFPKDNLLVVFDSTISDVQESGLTFVRNHTLYKILTTTGAKNLNALTFGYDPQSAYVEIQKATIYRRDGKIINLDLGSVMDYPAPARAIYWGAREIMIETGRLEPGDAVEVVMFKKGFTYALLQDDDDKYIPPMRGHFYDIVEFYSSNPVNLKVYQVKVPKEKSLQFEFYNGEAQVSGWIKDDEFVYTFSKTNMVPIKSEQRMVAKSDVAPKLLISTSPDWYAKSTWFFQVNEDYGSFDNTPEIQTKVNEILKDAKTELDSISLLTHWCADEIRYSGISMGEGEGFTLHKGEMTFTDRCGVCKDKAGMLITMLRAAGFESYPAMTMAGSRIDYIPADQFNHCVTVVKRHDGNYQLLDPTWVPFLRELWSSAEQQQQYLMGVPEGADLATTPISDPANHYIKITANAELEATGTLTGNLIITAEGQSDGSVRRFFKYSNKTQWDQNIEREFLRIHPKAMITELEFGDPMDYMAGPIRIKIAYTIPDYAVVAGKTMIFTPILAAQLFKSTQSHLYFNPELEKRSYPFRDRCSRQVEITESIKLPDIKQTIRIPGSVDKTGQVASIKAGYQLNGNELRFTEQISLGKRIYKPEEWSEYKTVVENQNRFAEEPVIVEINN